MSIKGLKRFYDDYRCCQFVVFETASILPDPDEECGYLTYESPPCTYSDQRRKNKAKRVRFLNDSEFTEYRYRFGYSPLKNRSVEWKDRGWTARYIVRLWQERIRRSSDPKCVEERDFWFSVGMDWGWDSFWSLDVDRVWYRKQVLPDISTFQFRSFLVGSVLFLLLLL